MTSSFSFLANPRLEFGWGRLSLLPELAAQRARRVFVVADPFFPESKAGLALFEGFKRNSLSVQTARIQGEPSPDFVDELATVASAFDPELVVGIGGGSAIDAGKAVAALLAMTGKAADYLEDIGTLPPDGRKKPYFAVPTTAGTGSEATKNAVLSSVGPDGYKKSLRHDAYVPDLALVDPSLLATCPQSTLAACALDALCQLLESYFSVKSTPLTDSLAVAGLKASAEALPLLLDGSRQEPVLCAASWAAYLSGLCLANAGLGAVHGIAGALGGLHPVPHGVACGYLVLPVMKFTLLRLQERGDRSGALEKFADVGRILSRKSGLGAGEARTRFLEFLCAMIVKAKLPALSSFGFSVASVEAVASRSGNKHNPANLSAADIRSILAAIA